MCTNAQQHCSGHANEEMAKASGRKFSGKISEIHRAPILECAGWMELDTTTFSVWEWSTLDKLRYRVRREKVVVHSGS
jgi:hypothetical protein